MLILYRWVNSGTELCAPNSPLPIQDRSLKLFHVAFPIDSQRKYMSLKPQPNKKTLPASKAEPSNGMWYLQSI